MSGAMGPFQCFPKFTCLPRLTVALILFWNIQAAMGELMPAMYVLGDSLIDPGNNNYILTLAKSNFPPNGLDFPDGATGRFCNGRTTADNMAQMMGLPFPPPYLSPKAQGPVILQGINYGSAAAGILDSTGYNYIGRIPLSKQLDFVEKTKAQITEMIGEAKTADLYANALFYITIGSNDYINNYLLTGSATSKNYTPQEYEDLLISEFNKLLRRLYSIGGRKVFIFNVGPLGCIPSQLYNQNSPDGSCIEFVNGYVRGFNSATSVLLKQLTASLPGSIFVYAKAYDVTLSFINEPSKYGFTVVNKGCCGAGPYNGALPCILGLIPCPDRATTLFWDAFHPTDKANAILASAFYQGGTDVIEPVNVMQLASMKP